MKKRILFVEEHPKARHQLEADLKPLEAEFEMAFVGGGSEALARMDQNPCDAIITDLRLSVVNGAQLLNEIMERFPGTKRFVLSDLSDRQALMKCVGTAHQFLSKPCDSVTLRAALEQAFSYDTWLPSDKARAVLAEMHKLPSPPHLYFEVVRALQSPDASLENIGQRISRDPAMTAKILQLVNSAVFGLKRTVASPSEAVMFLGVDTTKSVILLAHTFSYFDQIKDSDFSADMLWNHSIMTGNFARWIAEVEAVPKSVVETSYTAGMLHDIGKLALAANLPRKYTEAGMITQSRGCPLHEAEAEVFGVGHEELGACLLAIWGLPIDIVEAVALHHHPARFLSQSFCPLTAVHVANAIAHAESSGSASLPVDSEYLAQLGLDQKLPQWWEHCRKRAGKDQD